MGKYLLNEVGRGLVEEAVDALVKCSGGAVARLDGFEKCIKNVIRADVKSYRDERVTVICGGGSGHEPAYAGMVGDGLLDGAVCGDVFASPTSAAVFACIEAVCGEAGCVVVVMNYMGDRLCFGKAVEKARARGYKVELVVVADDVGITVKSPRGVAGTLLALKACCGHAAQGKAVASVADVAGTARLVAGMVKTYGVALTDCTMPAASEKPTRLAPGTMELGLGIHGEPGRQVIDLESSSALANRIITSLKEHIEMNDAVGLVLLVNNLGTSIPLEVTRYTADALAACEANGLSVTHHIAGAFVTSLDMHGFSLSLLPVGQREMDFLLAPAACPVWKPLIKNVPSPAPVVVDTATAGTRAPVPLSDEESKLLRTCLAAACTVLCGAEDELNDLDKKVGDGDCGSSMKRGAEQVLADADTFTWGDAGSVFDSLAASMEHGMGGTSGGLYVIAAEAAAAALRNGGGFRGAFSKAVEAIAFYGGATIGSCTMLDALLPAAESLSKGATAKDALAAAQAGRDSTADIVASHGRTTYFADDQVKGVPDPGAVAAVMWIQAVVSALE